MNVSVILQYTKWYSVCVIDIDRHSVSVYLTVCNTLCISIIHVFNAKAVGAVYNRKSLNHKYLGALTLTLSAFFTLL